MGEEIYAALLGAIAGGGAGLFTTLWGEHLRRNRIWRGLDLSISEPYGTKISGRAINKSPYSMEDCYVYISVEYDPHADVVAPPMVDREASPRVTHTLPLSAYVTPKTPVKFKDDRLCWSMAGNPATMNIYSGEHQAFELLLYDPDRKWIGIFSETHGNPYRVFLRGDKSYDGEIKIVSKDTRHKSFEIVINLAKPDPVQLKWKYLTY